MFGILPFAMRICNVEVPLSKKRKFGKNPEVDTSFLPDRDREVMKHLWFRVSIENTVNQDIHERI